MLHKSLSSRVAAAAVVAVACILSGCGEPSPQELMAAAQELSAKGDHRGAIIQLKVALQADAQQPEARLLLGKALLDSGDAPAAVLELEKALDLKVAQDRVLPLLTQALMGTGQAKKVSDLYASTRLQDPLAHAALKATVAAAFGAQGQIERAQFNVDQALQLDPKNMVARLLQARLTAGRGDMDRALAQVDALLADDPKQVNGWHLRGEISWIGKSDPVAGREAFKKAVELQPRAVQSHTALINTALQLREVAAYREHVDAMKKALPGHPETLFMEAQRALLDDDTKAAREIVQQLLRLAPDNHRVLQLAGALELRVGALVMAETHLNKALQFEPRLPFARRLLAQTYLRGGQPARALAALEPLLEQSSPSRDILVTAAEAFLHNGQLAEAEAHFTRAAKLDPDDPRIKTALALAQIAKGNPDSGLEALEALAASDTSAVADMALVSALMRRKDTAAALSALDRLQHKQPKEVLPHLLRGQVMAMRQDRPGARGSFEQALAIDANYYPAIANLAVLDVVEGKPEAAMKRLEAELAREPRNFRALLALVELKQKSGATPQAIRDLLDQGVKASPREAAPRLLLVDFLLSRNDTRAALAAAQDGVATLPDSMVLLDALGRAQLAAGELQQALSAFGRVAAAQPSSVPAQLRLAEAQMRNKDLESAVRSVQRALQVDPQSLPAQRGLMSLAMAKDKPEEALTVARTVQRQRPKEATGYLLEGEIHAARRNWDGALRALRTALERNNTTAIAMRVHALLSLAGRQAEADRFATQWMREHTQDRTFMIHLGAVAMDSANHAAAQKHYEAALALRGDDPLVLNNLAWVMLQQGKQGSLAHAEKAVALAPDNAAIIDTLAAILAGESQLPKAIEWQRKAVAKATAASAPAYRLRLAKLLIQGGDKAAARSELEALKALGKGFRSQDEVADLLKQTS